MFRLLLFITFFCPYFSVFSQLDSVSVSISVLNNSSSNTDIISNSLTKGDLVVAIQFNNLDSLGCISLDLYDIESHRHFKSIVKRKNEISAGEIISQQQINIIFSNIPINRSYKLITTLQDNNLYYFTPFVTSYIPVK